jgi:SAM-dependent methyltransferase
MNRKLLPELITQNLDIFVCPACGGALTNASEGQNVRCTDCSRSFDCEEGIPLLFLPNDWDSREDVTDIVKSFYEETPFPNYEGLDSSWSLRQKAEKGIFANLLDKEIPHGARILEAGCGTGQLTNFLGTSWGRALFGTDMCLNSLRLANQFKEKNQIDNAAFLQMNLFRPVFRPESFDLVICNGVLHHTSDPFRGFQSILGLVKKGGFIIVGLYNRYGRITTDVRRLIFRLCGNRLKSLDPRLRDASVDPNVRHTWFMDQYKNPHESKHTFGEVLGWFDQCGVEFVGSIPKSKAFELFTEEEKLFKSNPRGRGFDRFLVQLGMALGRGKEGGFFTMIGQKS